MMIPQGDSSSSSTRSRHFCSVLGWIYVSRARSLAMKTKLLPPNGTSTKEYNQLLLAVTRGSSVHSLIIRALRTSGFRGRPEGHL
jgi:hypothetical protein